MRREHEPEAPRAAEKGRKRQRGGALEAFAAARDAVQHGSPHIVEARGEGSGGEQWESEGELITDSSGEEQREAEQIDVASIAAWLEQEEGLYRPGARRRGDGEDDSVAASGRPAEPGRKAKEGSATDGGATQGARRGGK